MQVGTGATLTIPAATLTINDPVIITGQPVSVGVLAGGSASFSVTATGSGLNYQWRKGGIDLPGEVAPTLLLSTVTLAEAGSYTCVVSGSGGSPVISPAAELVVVASLAAVYVDGAYSGAPGALVSFPVGGPAQGKVLGLNAFVTIQSAIDAADVGGTVSIAASGFAENLVVGKQLRIIGAGAGNCDGPADPLTQTVITSAAAGTPVVSITAGGTSAADRLTVSGLRLTGATGDPALSIPGCAAVRVTAATGTTLSFFRFDGLTLKGNAGAGLAFAGTDGSVSDVDVVDTNVCSNYVGIWNETDMAGLTRVSISGGAIRSNTYNGVRSNGRTSPTAWTPTDVSIVGTVFASNGQSSNSFPGSGDVSFYEFNGSATLTNVTVATTGRNPVQFRGRGTASTATWLPSGAVSINGLTVTGTADRSAIVIQNYSDVAAVTLSNVNLAGVTNTNPPGTAFSVTGMTLTHTGATPLALGNTVFPCHGTGYAGLAVFGSGGAAADCTTVFTGATTLAAKEACVFDGDDLAGFGNVSFPDSVITGQPTSATVCDGQPVTLTVSATGDNLSYQWFNGANPVGTNSASYSIPAASGTDAGTYTVVVTGTCGAVTSSAATVTVNTAPVVAALPAAPTICAGSGFVLTAAATGTGPFSYQWRKDGSPMLTETGVTFSINVLAPGNAGSYDVVVTNTCGSTTSTTSVLTVGSAPVITSQPAPASVAIGGTGSFSVAASATPGPLGYQWCRNGINLPNAGPYGGANTPMLTISPASLVITGSFDCIVTAPCGTTTSAAALLSVGSAPVITQQPLPAFVRVNDCVKLVAAATGGNPLTVQWRKDGLPLADGGSYSGVSTLSLTICPVTPAEGGNYELVATNPFGTATSNPAAVAINPSCNCADIVSSLALPPGDGTIDGNDFISFINAFAIDDPLADIAGPEGCSPDGTIDGFDFIAFINDFAAGCP